MNNVIYGRKRDEVIVNLITKGNAFNRNQIEQIIFSGKKCSKRIAQKRLSHLFEIGKINKMQKDYYMPAIYYVDKPKHLQHTLAINDVYTALVTQKPSWCTLDFKWSYNVLNGKLWADALITIYTLPDRQGKKVFFLEVERSPSKKFDKPEKYQSVYNSIWHQEEWATLKVENGITKAIFPKILIVTEEELKIKSKLNFIVATPEEIQKDVYTVLRR